MPHPKGNAKTRKRRVFSEEFKQEAVQMLQDGHSASSVAEGEEDEGHRRACFSTLRG